MQVNFPITPSALLTFGLVFKHIEHLWICFELLKSIHAYIEESLLESIQLYTLKNI